MNNIRYADDTVLIAETEKDLQHILDKVIKESGSLGLALNAKKTYSMTVSKKQIPPKCTLTASGIEIKHVENFNYLGSFLTSDGKSDCEIKRRIALSKEAFSKKRSVLTSSNITMSTRQRILNCYIWSILVYGCETWSISSVMQKRLEATEMWFLRRMLKISWTDKISNERVLTIANVKRKLLQTIKNRKMTFLGHVMRRKGIEKLSLTGKVEGKRARGTQRMTYLSNIKEWTNRTNGNELIQACQDRAVWRSMTVNALAHDT